MTQEEAFEAAKTTILEMRPDADNFYLDEVDFEDGNWVILIGYLRYWDAEDIDRAENEFLGLTNDDIGEPSGHWQSQIIVFPSGEGDMTTDDILDITDHPEYSVTTEAGWRTWAIGDREGRDED